MQLRLKINGLQLINTDETKLFQGNHSNVINLLFHQYEFFCIAKTTGLHSVKINSAW